MKPPPLQGRSDPVGQLRSADDKFQYVSSVPISTLLPCQSGQCIPSDNLSPRLFYLIWQRPRTVLFKDRVDTQSILSDTEEDVKHLISDGVQRLGCSRAAASTSLQRGTTARQNKALQARTSIKGAHALARPIGPGSILRCHTGRHHVDWHPSSMVQVSEGLQESQLV